MRWLGERSPSQFALGVLRTHSVITWRSTSVSRRGLAAILGVGGLIVTWVLLFIVVAAVTEAWMVPWDVRPGRPPIGTAARALNDFFETSPGSNVPAAILVTASAVLFVIRAALSADRSRVPWVFAGLNLGFMFFGIPLAAAAHLVPYLWLPQPRPEPDIGYHLEWPSIMSLLVFEGLLLWAQWRFSSPVRSQPIADS